MFFLFNVKGTNDICRHSLEVNANPNYNHFPKAVDINSLYRLENFIESIFNWP